MAKALPLALHGQWFEFEDSEGHGFCQPDLLLDWKSEFLVLEVKYTWTELGHRQIDELYRPVLEAVYQRAVRGIVVCKALVPGMPGVRVASDLQDACWDTLIDRRTGKYKRVALHWLATGTPLAMIAKLPSPFIDATHSLSPNDIGL